MPTECVRAGTLMLESINKTFGVLIMCALHHDILSRVLNRPTLLSLAVGLHALQVDVSKLTLLLYSHLA